MKPSFATLMRPEANTSMPVLIAEAKGAQKCANIEYAAHNSNHTYNGNSRNISNSNKEQYTSNNHGSNNYNINCSQSFNCSRPKKEDTAKVNNAKVVTHYKSDPTLSDLEGLDTKEE